MKRKKYKIDVDGVYLMRSAFPEVPSTSSLKKVEKYQKAINQSAQRFYKRNYSFLKKVGFEAEDIESIMVSNSYVFFIKNPDAGEFYLNKFLKQRATKLNSILRRREETVAESTTENVPIHSIDVADYSDPEKIVLAKERVREILKTAEEALILPNLKEIQRFVEKNRKKLLGNGLLPEVIYGMVQDLMLSVAFENGTTISSKTFKKHMDLEFEKILGALK